MGTVAMVKAVKVAKQNIKKTNNNIADLDSHIANLQAERESQRANLLHWEFALEDALEDLIEAH